MLEVDFSTFVIDRLRVTLGEDPPARRDVAVATTCGPASTGADQSIRWAKDTMIPSGPRTDAMRQMPSY